VADESLVFDDLAIGDKFCWDHRRRNLVPGWCAGLEHGLLKKMTKTSYAPPGQPKQERALWHGAERWLVCRDTDVCGGVPLCARCKDRLYDEVRRDLCAKVDLCDECVKHQTEEVAARAKHAREQRFLRRLVDVVWQTCSESEAVPSTDWADRMIAQARKEDAEDSDEEDA
jgi:hypothetical protein